MICDFTSRHDGLGASPAAIVSMTGNLAAGVVPGILASTVTPIAAGGTGLLLGLAPALAVPIIGAAIAGVTLAISLFLNRNAQYFGEESATTQIVNQAETLLKQNLAAWQSLSSTDKTLANQTQALANFDGVWNQVVQACSNTAYSTGSDSTGQSPGARCVADRAGVSHGGNGKYDWYAYYRDPIANDQIYQPPINQTISSGVDSLLSVLSPSSSPSSSISVGGISLIPIILLGLGAWALSEVL